MSVWFFLRTNAFGWEDANFMAACILEVQNLLLSLFLCPAHNLTVNSPSKQIQIVRAVVLIAKLGIGHFGSHFKLHYLSRVWFITIRPNLFRVWIHIFAMPHTYFHNSNIAGTIKIGKHIFYISRSVLSGMKEFSLEDPILLLNNC